MYVDVAAVSENNDKGRSMWCSVTSPDIQERTNEKTNVSEGLVLSGSCISLASALSPQYDRSTDVFLSLSDLEQIFEFAFARGLIRVTANTQGE